MDQTDVLTESYVSFLRKFVPYHFYCAYSLGKSARDRLLVR